MTGAAISIAELETMAEIAPDMPAHMVVKFARWVAEMRPEPVSIVEGPETAAVQAEQSPAWPCVEIPSPAGSGYAYAPPRPEPDETPANPAPPPAAPDRTGMPWEVDEVETALKMHNGGAIGREIAGALGRPIHATYAMLKKAHAGWRPKPAARLDQAAPVERAAAPDLTSSQRQMMARIMRLPDDFTPADDLYLADQVLQRTPLDQIGDHLGCTAVAVKVRWAALVDIDPDELRKGVPLRVQEDLMIVLRHLAGQAAA